MGVVSDACLAAGGEVTGVIPKALLDWEVGHQGLSRLEVVDSMHTRKARMAELSDGFIALPGGLRITSYNVCYTKLLRPAQGCGRRHPVLRRKGHLDGR